MKKIRWMRKAFAIFLLVMMIMPTGGHAGTSSTTYTLADGTTITIEHDTGPSAPTTPTQPEAPATGTGTSTGINIPAASTVSAPTTTNNGVNVNVDNDVTIDNDANANVVIVGGENNTESGNNNQTIIVDNDATNNVGVEINVEVNVELSENGWASSPWWSADGNNAGHAKGCNCTYNLRHCSCNGDASKCTCLRGGHQSNCTCNKNFDCGCGGHANTCDCNQNNNNTCSCGSSSCTCTNNGGECKCDSSNGSCNCGDGNNNNCSCGSSNCTCTNNGGTCNCGNGGNNNNCNCGNNNNNCNCGNSDCKCTENGGKCECGKDGGTCNCGKGGCGCNKPGCTCPGDGSCECGGENCGDGCNCKPKPGTGGCGCNKPECECPDDGSCECGGENCGKGCTCKPKPGTGGCGCDDTTCTCKPNGECECGGENCGDGCTCQDKPVKGGCGCDDSTCTCLPNGQCTCGGKNCGTGCTCVRPSISASLNVSSNSVNYYKTVQTVLTTNAPLGSSVVFYAKKGDNGTPVIFDVVQSISSKIITSNGFTKMDAYDSYSVYATVVTKDYGSVNSNTEKVKVEKVNPGLTIDGVSQNGKTITVRFSVKNPTGGKYPTSTSGNSATNVQFTLGGEPASSKALSYDGNTSSFTHSFTATINASGIYTLAASYAGDTNYNRGDATLNANLTKNTGSNGGGTTDPPIIIVVPDDDDDNNGTTNNPVSQIKTTTTGNSKLTTLVDNDTPLAGNGPVVRLLDQQGKELELYDSTIQPGSGGMVKIDTTFKRKHYTYEFNVAEMRAYANYYPQGEYQIEADGIAFNMPYAFHSAFLDLNDYLTENSISINTLRLRATFEAMDDFTTKTALTNSPGVELDSPLWRVSFSLHDPLGTDIGFDTNVDTLEVPLELQLATSEANPVAVICDPATESVETAHASVQKGRAVIEANYPADYGVGTGEVSQAAGDGAATTSSTETAGEGVG